MPETEGLVKRVKPRAVEDHRLIELADQPHELGHLHVLAGLGTNPLEYLSERQPAIEVADDTLIGVEWDEDRVGCDACRIVETDEQLSIPLEPAGRQGAELRPVEGAHPSFPREDSAAVNRSG